MKQILFFILLSTISFGLTTPEEENWKVVPCPNNISIKAGSFTFGDGVAINYSDKSLKNIVKLFEQKLNKEGISTGSKTGNKIELKLDNSIEDPEGYVLKITTGKIKLTAGTPQGIFYGSMTILQNIKHANTKTVPCGSVNDAPRFKYRGFMLDESRHFFGKEKVKQILDMMSELKLNTFHWHLTDEPAWRIEIKAYPELTTVGGRGNYTDPDAPAKYYTQDEIKEIVTYAADRFITIIPEIDMPGHATAANRAYPEFSGGGSKKHPDFTFNPGKEGTYEYLTTILREVAGLFPAPYIHLGGDEVHYGNEMWNTDQFVQELMKKENLKTLTDVEHYFIRRMTDSIASLGKKTAGWDEITESGVPKDELLVYWWRHDKPDWLNKALANKYQIVLCPRIPLYFDFVQDASHKNGRKWAGNFCTTEDVYNYPDSKHSFNAKEKDLIKGIQANLWTERFETDKQLDFMTYPRILALAESAWTDKNDKNFKRFEQLLPSWFDYFKQKNIYYFNVLDPASTPEPKPINKQK